MCGRYTLIACEDELREAFDLIEADGVGQPLGFGARYNIAPTQDVPIIRQESGKADRRLELLRWGLVPHWAKDESIGNRMINARSETAAEKPSFKMPLQRQRCLVPSTGFYEWQEEKGPGGKKYKQPYFIKRGNRSLFAMAGLWSRWEKGPDGLLETFTILTTSANNTLAPLHHRMPVVLPPDDYDQWLDPECTDPDELLKLLKPAPDQFLEFEAVSTHVNNARNDDPTCIDRATLF
jgi:putative SOS response-associated peptidase YedK